MRKSLRVLCLLVLALLAFDIVQDSKDIHQPNQIERTACHSCACGPHLTVTQTVTIARAPTIVQRYSCEPTPTLEQPFAAQFLRPPRRVA